MPSGASTGEHEALELRDYDPAAGERLTAALSSERSNIPPEGPPVDAFVAITDPGTPLVAHAAAAGYRHTFVNPADIGGRYSALSLFGLGPAGGLGLDPNRFPGDAQAMADRCRHADATNPGLALGEFMAEHSARGRDKLTLLPTATIGLWIEQLVAESTGKTGRGVLPIVDEPHGPIAEYGTDRAFVALTGAPAGTGALSAAGHPVFALDGAGADQRLVALVDRAGRDGAGERRGVAAGHRRLDDRDGKLVQQAHRASSRFFASFSSTRPRPFDSAVITPRSVRTS